MQNTRMGAPQAGVSSQADARPEKYLMFKLVPEEFGVRVSKVREIMGMQQITAVPQAPAYLKGVIHLRGKVMPVIDLRLKFGLQALESTQRTCIVVVEVEREAGTILVGLIVDGVSEVLNVARSDILAPSDIEAAPGFGAKLTAQVILGTVKLKGKVKTLLDIDRVVSAQEMAGLDGLAA